MFGHQNGGSLSYVDFSVDEFTREVVSSSATQLAMNESVPFDPVASIKLMAAEELASRERVVGLAVAQFSCPENPFSSALSNCARFGESTVGNLAADALLEYGRKQGATAAVINGGSIRSIIDAGEVTDKDLKAVLPFANTLSILQVTGYTLGQALNNSVSRLGATSGTGRFLQMAGIRMSYDMSLPAQGRVFDVFVQNSTGYWKPLNPDKIYGVALPDYLRFGGDDYTMFKLQNVGAFDGGPSISSLINSYVEARYPKPGIRPLLRSRITNATAGARRDLSACVSSLVATAQSGQISDEDCLGNERTYTMIDWVVNPVDTSNVAIRLTITLDSRFFQVWNHSAIQPSAANWTEHIRMVLMDSTTNDGPWLSSRSVHIPHRIIFRVAHNPQTPRTLCFVLTVA